MPILGALCDVARNLFYLLTIALIGFGAYAIFEGGVNVYLKFMAIGWIVSLILWRLLRAMLPSS